MAAPPDGMAIALQRIAAEAANPTGVLDLCELGLTDLPEALFQLTELKRLHLGWPLVEAGGEWLSDYQAPTNAPNRLAGELDRLARLPKLEALSIQGMACGDLAPLATIGTMLWLDCNDTQVIDLGPLSGLSALQSLDCSGTQVTDLGPLSGLSALQSLNCSRCNLIAPPEDLWRRLPLLSLYLLETSIPGIPSTVLSQTHGANCLDSLRAHLADKAAGADEDRTVKLLVLGNGRAGKTQLCRLLRGQDFQPESDSTHGISVSSFELPAAGRALGARVNVWDFGGQDIYHGTHALFVRSSAVFLVVWARRTEQAGEYELGGIRFRNHPLQYWADYVLRLAGARSPVVLAQTQCDARSDDEARFPVSAQTLDSLGFVREVRVSARPPRRGQGELVAALWAAVDDLRESQGIAVVGRGRLKVQRRIEDLHGENGVAEADRLMDQATFRHWCEEAGDISSPEALLAYLHNAGVVFYQRGLFGDQIVIDHGWALSGIYAVFDRERSYQRLKKEGGRFDLARLGELVWNDQGYTPADQRLLLSMMRSCGICFPHHQPSWRIDDETTYIAPDLLPDRAAVQTELDDRWGFDPPDHEATFGYPLLHAGLMRAVIAQIGEAAGLDAVYWRGGVYVYESTTRSKAIVEQEAPPEAWSGTIRMRTRGGRGDELLTKLAEIVRAESERAGLTPDETAMTPILSRAFAGPEPPKLEFAREPVTDFTYCVSYAWGDDTEPGKAREARVDELCAEASRRAVPILRDKTALGLGDRLTEFMARIGAGDRIFVVLSDAYLKSRNCAWELCLTWANCRGDAAEFARRTRIYRLGDAAIFSAEGREGYARHWREELAKSTARVAAYLAENRLRDLPLTEVEREKRVAEIAGRIAEILSVISDMLLPGETEAEWRTFLDYGFEDPLRP